MLVSVDLTPVVGPEMFTAGRIATLHACSDIYAAGGRPVWGLVILVTQPNIERVAYEALLGGVFRAAEEESLVIVGGHSLISDESLIGLVVGGTPASDRVLTRYGASSGDTLLLSKPLGPDFHFGLASANHQMASDAFIHAGLNGPKKGEEADTQWVKRETSRSN